MILVLLMERLSQMLQAVNFSVKTCINYLTESILLQIRALMFKTFTKARHKYLAKIPTKTFIQTCDEL